MNLTTKDLQTILYSLEGYIQGNDDTELVEELDTICNKIVKELEVKVWTNSSILHHNSFTIGWMIALLNGKE